MSFLITLSDTELSRLEVVQRIRQRRLSVVKGAALLHISRSQMHRLLKAYGSDGAEGLVSKKRGKPSNRRYSREFRNTAGPVNVTKPGRVERANGVLQDC